jgi:hypothetical protein
MVNKRIIFFIIFSVFFLFQNCNVNDEKTIIPEDKLKEIFFDFHVAEYVINRAPSVAKDSLKALYSDQIFKIHKVKREDFLHDAKLIEKNPERFQKFYEEIENYGNELKKNKTKVPIKDTISQE